MTHVHTVRGPVPVDQLGATLMHEHVFILGDEIRQNYPDYPSPWDEEKRVADAIDQLRQAKSRGIDTIVDPTVIGLGRYLPRIQRVNDQVDINIVVATGIYTYNDVPFHFLHTGPGLLFDTPEPMVELFV
ncbi:phosphotriesterase-related protein, partial [Mycobacterium sp. CBMA361]|nr:phosphotriesterase-related protein [Mycolicibacterium sp. CBMA 361]